MNLLKLISILSITVFANEPLFFNKDMGEIIILTQDPNSNIANKCIWINITNPIFLDNAKNYYIEWKTNFSSKNSNLKSLENVRNYNGGIYYYAYVPVDCECFRVKTANADDEEIATTKWKSFINVGQLFEVYEGSYIIRHRSANVFPPDAYVLGLFLSNFYSCCDKYENGYSAFKEIETYWLPYYSGNTKGTLDNTFFYDYPVDCNADETTEKTRLISVQNKIDELRDLYSTKIIKSKKSEERKFKVGLIFFCFSLVLSILVTLLILKFFRRKKA